MKVFKLVFGFFLVMMFASCGTSNDNSGNKGNSSANKGNSSANKGNSSANKGNSSGNKGNNSGNDNSACFSSAMKDSKAKCSSIEVKASPNDANDKRMLKVYYSIIPSINKSTNKEPIVFLVGGPGPSNTAEVDNNLHGLSHLFQNRDMIVMDYRGTGFTEPYPTCDNFLTKAGLDKEKFKQCIASLDKVNIKLSDYTSANIAYDLNKVLEKEKINKVILVGESYGTRVATTMARDYPNKVSAMILDGWFTIEANGISQAKESILDKLSDLSLKYDKKYPDAKLRDILEKSTQNNKCAQRDLKELAKLAYSIQDEKDLSILNEALNQPLSKECLISNRSIDEKYSNRFMSSVMALGVIMYEEAYFMDNQKPHDFGFGPNVLKSLDTFQGGAPIDISSVDFMRPYFTAIPKQIEIKPLKTDIPTIIFTAGLDFQTTKYWAINAQKHLSNNRHFFFKDQGHGFSNDKSDATNIIEKFLNNYSDLSVIDAIVLEDSNIEILK